VSDSGEEVKSVPFADVGLVRPLDLREWRGRLAVAEGNTDAQAVVLINLDSWIIEETIEVPDALVELRGLLEESSNGCLQLVVGSRESHLVSSASAGADCIHVSVPSDKQARNSTESLNAREREILGMFAAGLPNKVVARELSISEQTVSVHARNMYRKLRVASRVQAVLLYLSQSQMLTSPSTTKVV
jgi:DNA-binding CsgD family transcriptional regulator